MKVLILTHSEDNDCVARVQEAVSAAGGRAWRLDTDRFPSEVQLSSSSDADGRRLRAVIDGEELELSDLTAVWHRRIHVAAKLPESMEPQLRQASVKESLRTLYGMFAGLDAFVIDPVQRIRFAENKEVQLRLAREQGLAVPRTLISNEPEAVRAFHDRCGGCIVVKMQSSFAIHEDGVEHVVFTNPVSDEDLAHLDGLRYSPMQFQEQVPKALELRTTVVGERVFTASIDSGALERSKQDWRREGVALLDRWERYELPEAERAGLLKMMDRLGLNYGAADWILTPDGRHVFLEVNPAGEFFWLERNPGFPITSAIADVLLGRAARREAPLLRPA